jgi:LytS/YehU family sensor histidine kinase
LAFKPPGKDNDGNRFRIVTLRLALIYAAAEFLISSPIWLTIGDNPLKPLLGKLAREAVFVLVAILLAQLLSRMRRQSYGRQIAACLSLSLVSALGMSLLDAYLYSLIMLPVVVPFNIMDDAYAVCYRMSIFFGWSFLFVALLNHMDVRDRDLKLIASREQALAAQMRALQYQINPHFLFNTLNSITRLVEEGASERAERMIMSLSASLRWTLQLDPMRELRLADEMALQKEYLDIEKERFSDRMRVRIDIPGELEDAKVPSLILQPLVENAVKHGVGRSSSTVEILIRATRRGDRLNLIVENDVAVATAAGTGLGIGLANVAHRVRTHFPEGATPTAGPIGPRKYRVSLDMPSILA